MDWAEELKMSIRKTTARKGKRDKNRDVSQANSSASAVGMKNSTATSTLSPQISIDISLDLQQQQQSTNSDLSSNTVEPGDTSGDWNTTLSTGSTTGHSNNMGKRPHMLRRISGGWADATFSKSSKSKRDVTQIPELDTRTMSSSASVHVSSSKESIPTIPDMDDSDEYLNKDLSKKTSIIATRLNVLEEINNDLQEQEALCTTVTDVDLHILIDRLQPKSALIEANDEVWEWNKLFTEVIAEINADKPLQINNEERKSILGPDELPPPATTNTARRFATNSTLLAA